MGVLVRNGVAYGGTPIDKKLDTNSENAVQNKVVTRALNNKVTLHYNYLELENGLRLYISNTTPIGDIPEGSIGVGF